MEEVSRTYAVRSYGMKLRGRSIRSVYGFTLKATFVLLAVCSALFATGQTSPYNPAILDPITEEWRWAHFPELEGRGIRCIAEDNQGRTWFGVDNGVMMYDRREWAQYAEPDGLSGNPVDVLLSTTQGRLYAGCNLGIYVLDQDNWKKIVDASGIDDFLVYRMLELSDGTIMIATESGVLQLQGEHVVRVFTTAEMIGEIGDLGGGASIVTLPQDFITGTDFHFSDIIEDSRDNIWFALSLANRGKLLQFKQRELTDDQIGRYTIHADHASMSFGEDPRLTETFQGEIWVVNRSNKIGVGVFNGKKWKQIRLNDLFGTDEYCTEISQTGDGTIWIASLGKLYKFKDEAWNIYSSSDYHIPTNKLILAESRDQGLWICGLKSQVYLFDYSPQRWSSYNNLNFQCESADGRLWFIDAAGNVVINNRGSWNAYDTRSGLIDAPVRLIATRQGELWAAGSHNGIAATAYLKGDKWYRQMHPSLSWGIDYRAVLEAMDGSLWFGGAVDFDQEQGQQGGVMQMRYDDNGEPTWSYHHYRDNGLNQSNAYGIGQSRDGLIWIGGGSLFYYDGEQWQQTDQPLLQDFVNIVQSTPEGLLLCGSRYHGIFIYDGDTWKNYNTNSGLLSNTIMSLHGSGPHAIWAATERDISLFDGENWVNSVLPDQLNINYEGGAIQSTSDGAIWINQSLREWNRRAYLGKRGEAYPNRTLISYKYLPDDHPPETAILVYSDKVSQKGNTVVTWKGQDYMSATQAGRLTYSYRLDGGEWSPFTAQMHETFVNLGSGNHTLEVRARDLDLNIDPSPAQISFEVQPPVWKQTWFILLILAFITVIALFEYRVLTKNRTLEKLNASLSVINEELQDKNVEIESKSKEILEQQGQIVSQRDKLEESYRSLRAQTMEIQDQRDQLAEMVVKIESLNKYKLNFFTNVSHELRTPLSLILGPAHNLQDDQDIDAKHRSKFLKIIERNAYKLLKLINQLLEIRRIENEQLELRLSNGVLADFLGEIVQLFESLAAERQVNLVFENDCREIESAFDRDKVEKIVTNLISNAFKHTPAGGSIIVKLSRTGGKRTDKTNNSPVSDKYIITVRDTGTGISEERLPHIFERYYSDNSDRLSSGIGLSYIKTLVEQHHGSIAVESVKGKGTSFFVEIPVQFLSQEQDFVETESASNLVLSTLEVDHLFNLIEPDPQEITLPTAKPARCNVLVVENDPDMLDFLGLTLGEKYNVYKTANGKAGLEVARNHNIDLIVSDVMMPKIDGLQLCNEIKSDLVTSHIPVILLTAKILDDNRIEGYMQGADAYLTKPFDPKVLISRIDNLMKQRAQLRESFSRDFALSPKHVQLDSADDELLRTIVSIMEENIDEGEFNVNKMCHMVGMSHTHFIRKVKQLTGKKPVDLLKSFRLSRAKDLLKQNSANISEIAYMVGYNLPNSFSRAFKKEFNISPKEFAEQNSGSTPEGGTHTTDDIEASTSN